MASPGTSIREYTPSTSVIPPLEAPFTITVAPIIGSPLASTTIPVIFFADEAFCGRLANQSNYIPLLLLIRKSRLCQKLPHSLVNRCILHIQRYFPVQIRQALIVKRTYRHSPALSASGADLNGCSLKLIVIWE